MIVTASLNLKMGKLSLRALCDSEKGELEPKTTPFCIYVLHVAS